MVAPISIHGSDIAKLDNHIDDFCINISNRQYEKLDVLSSVLEGKSNQNKMRISISNQLTLFKKSAKK